MLRSLHIIGSRQMGGAESFFHRLVRALNEADHEAAAVVRPQSPLRECFPDEVEVYPVAMRNGWDLLSVAAIRRLIERTGVDIVQSYMGRASRLTRLPSGSRAVHVARLGGFYKIDGYYRHADAWVGNTRALCDYLVREGLSADKVFHISNFVEAPRPVDEAETLAVKRELGLSDDALVIFSLGRFIEIKGFGDLLRAFARLAPQTAGRPLHLVIAGDGPLREQILDLARELELADRFHWAGWIKDAAPYLAMTDIFAVPSTHETLGNVILEAWSAGLPVVSTTTPGGLELIVDGENGLLTPCGDAEKLAETMTRLLAMGAAGRNALGRSGYATLQANHTRAAVTDAYLEMYAQLCGRGR
jgi:glycosyltransferase involved in cell wall biosynthesis